VSTRILEPAIVAGVFFCLSAGILAMLWKAKQSYGSIQFGYANEGQRGLEDSSRPGVAANYGLDFGQPHQTAQ